MSETRSTLTPLHLKTAGHLDFPEDVARIVAAYAERGFQIAATEAAYAWETYSEDHYAAGWMSMGHETADSLFRNTRKYFDDPAPASPTRTDERTD